MSFTPPCLWFTGQRPYWFDLPKVIGDMIKELTEHLKNIRADLAIWVDEVKSSADPIKKLTGGAIDSVRFTEGFAGLEFNSCRGKATFPE